MGIPAIKKNVRASLSSGLMQKLPLAACLEGHRDHPAFEQGRERGTAPHCTLPSAAQSAVYENRRSLQRFAHCDAPPPPGSNKTAFLPLK